MIIPSFGYDPFYTSGFQSKSGAGAYKHPRTETYFYNKDGLQGMNPLVLDKIIGHAEHNVTDDVYVD